MPNIALLNNIEHKDLRIIPGHRPGLGSEVAWVPTFADEFRSLQAHYPIIFRQLDDGANYEAIALLGFQQDENLFLEDGRWDAPLVPWMHERLPFYIGRNGDELMIQVDLDHPRISKTEGEPVFKQHGGNTEFLEKTSAMLSNIHNGVQANAGFLEALKRHDLLDAFVLDIEFDNGEKSRMGGFFTIHEERLGALDGAAIAELHAAGHLAPMYFALASLSHFRDLIDRKNRRNSREAAGR